MKFIIITLFPDFINSFKNQGIVKKAIDKKIIDIYILDIRQYYKNSRIDNKQYGGGGGMVIKAEPLLLCINEAKKMLNNFYKIIYLSPKGNILNIDFINNILNYNIILICGRYKDIDERIILTEVDEEISIGDYILSGGELPSMVLMDTIIRLLPGVINNKNSYITDSFYNNYNLLGYPCYTKPLVFNNIKVPKILLSGNHKLIYEWRFEKSLEKTFLNRPELININKFNYVEKKIFYNFIKKNNFKYEK